MNTREEILAKLRANEPFGKNQDRSAFDIKALRSRWTISGRAANTAGNKRTQISQTEEERAHLEAQVESLRCELENCRQENQGLEQENLRAELTEYIKKQGRTCSEETSSFVQLCEEFKR